MDLEEVKSSRDKDGRLRIVSITACSRLRRFFHPPFVRNPVSMIFTRYNLQQSRDRDEIEATTLAAFPPFFAAATFSPSTFHSPPPRAAKVSRYIHFLPVAVEIRLFYFELHSLIVSIRRKFNSLPKTTSVERRIELKRAEVAGLNFVRQVGEPDALK